MEINQSITTIQPLELHAVLVIPTVSLCDLTTNQFQAASKALRYRNFGGENGGLDWHFLHIALTSLPFALLALHRPLGLNPHHLLYYYRNYTH